jgi:tetratricopeptide (TPR) repeat protein
MKPSTAFPPAFVQAMARASACAASGQLAQAEAQYGQLAQAAVVPAAAAAAAQAWALLALDAGRLDLAVERMTRAVVAQPENAAYQRNLGELCRRAGRLPQAVACGRAATRLAPDDLDAHYNLGLALADAKEWKRAVQSYRKALRLNPAHGLSWNNLGAALEAQGDRKGAAKAYARAVELNPRHAEAQNNLGALESEAGNLDAARACFEAAIAARGDFVEAHYNLSSLKTYTESDPDLQSLRQIDSRRSRYDAPTRIRLDFAYGKALDDIGAYDQAFAAYAEGNRLQHALLPCDEARADALLQAIMQNFDADFFARRSAWQLPGDARTPVFIVGMPRSGTTLLEQILSSHRDVFGAGELPDLNAVVLDVAGADFAAAAPRLDAAALRRIGSDYLERVWKLAPRSRIISDKMPANFFFIGLIHLALPGAKIIHALRDPLDSCFSCYSRLFNDTMEFAYDLGTLGRYYARYMTLMRHWHAVLPQGSILDLRYEDMVADTEAQARRVLDFVGLPWDPACLEFHRNRRQVKTASVAQVRKPIYTSSVARWRHFARHLKPLWEIVREFREDDDFPALEAAAPDPAAAHALHTRGIAAYRENRFDAALELYAQALQARPDYPEALNSQGFLLQDLGRLEEARDCFARAVALAPEMAMARLNLGMVQLKLGDWEPGWDNYEARWTGSAESARGMLQQPRCPLPQWRGEGDTAQRSLLVLTEQGFGDTFQFSRYLELAARRFARVGFVCSAPTLRLMEWAFGDRIALFSQMPVDFDDWDLHSHLLSLPRAFGTRVDSIPARTPYLRVPEPAAAFWRARLQRTAPGRIRVGIAWAGRKAHMYDARRSLRLAQLEPLLGDARVTWVSLQKWAPEDERPRIPQGVDWLDWTDELLDFADSAALVANLDLVISIDSAMVHLAGALRRPVWLLNRYDAEWRWLRDRAASPWYPELRMFAQPAFGDWDSVIADAAAALAQWPTPVAARPAPARAPRARRAAAAAGQQLSVAQALELAARRQGEGRLSEAAALLDKVLAADPRNAHALHLQGVVAYHEGKPELAIDLIRQAIARRGDVALFHSNLGEMCRQLGRLQLALEHGRRAVALDSGHAAAHSNLGVALYDAKDYAAAAASHQRALELAPSLVQSLNNLGSIARERGDLAAAAGWYRRALQAQPDHVEALSNLGAALVEDERADAAVPYLERALALRPDFAEALCNLGLARLHGERTGEAEALLQRALQCKPGYAQALLGLARLRSDQDRPRAAEALLRQALAAQPGLASAHSQLGGVLTELGAVDAARASYLRALELDAGHVDARLGLGNLSLEQGDLAGAQRELRAAVAQAPDHVGARFHLLQAIRVRPGDPDLAALEAMLPLQADWPVERRVALHYALGKAYDDLGDAPRAFPQFLEGARLKRGRLHYDAAADEARTRRIADVVDRDWLERLRGAGDPDATPVFVLGMPRSGTTLTEQIIASHPDAHGAGELPDLLEIAQGAAGPDASPLPFPENLLRLDRAGLAAWSADYLARLRGHASRALRITDKMPSNYLAVGLIAAMLPNARIVHVVRDPVDTCLSCFTRLFNRHQEATYDLAELGRHYRAYAALMRHWHALLPGRMLEVRYEDIVADLDGQARRLIAHCGLPWDDACLAFHQNARQIRTASLAQVRRPLYSSSVQRWRRYAADLGPLLDALGDLVPD